MATVKEINHDSSTNINVHYSSVTDTDGAITVGAAAALNSSTYGVAMDYDAGANEVILSEGFVFSATELRMRFRVNVNTLAYAGAGANPLIVNLITSSDSDVVFMLRVNADAAGDFNLIIEYLTSGGTTVSNTGYDLLAADTCIELRAIRETSAVAGDGVIEVLADGVSLLTVSDATNFEEWNDVIDTVEVRFASPAGLTGVLYYDEWILDNNNAADLGCGPVLGLAAMTKPADVDAAGQYIYVCLLKNGTPILTQIATSLAADGTTVFDPAAGTNIGVECGRFSSDVVWVAGAFDGTNTVEKSEDAGASFVVKDGALLTEVFAFVMGPDSDDRILVNDNDTNIVETIDSGDNWTTINNGAADEHNAIGRLGENVQETVFGNLAAVVNNLDYSVNSGANLEDLILPVSVDVTGVIVN